LLKRTPVRRAAKQKTLFNIGSAAGKIDPHTRRRGDHDCPRAVNTRRRVRTKVRNCGDIAVLLLDLPDAASHDFGELSSAK
jgi:hypothetical protein